MSSKISSFEEKVKLPPNDTFSYQPHSNRKVIRILTVAVYVLCVSLAAIMLSLYYIFLWDPTIRPFVTKTNNCDKIVIPEKIAIRLLNSSEVTAEQFFKNILQQYRILNQLQLQRQEILQKQHLQFQQLATANKFKEIFATATIIQSNANNERLKPIIKPANDRFYQNPVINSSTVYEIDKNQTKLDREIQIQNTKQKSHRKHLERNHRLNAHKMHSKKTEINKQTPYKDRIESSLNSRIANIDEPTLFTSMPIPLIFNSKEEKHLLHHGHTKKRNIKESII